ncbi:MAG TPA: hypothetical protein VFJ58_03980 [Armatimonadota bacterium]|nr:hypothetical protein [Armatimonadota bacterium]
MRKYLPFPALFLLFLYPHTARAADNRVYLVSQYDFGAKTGFYLDFENSSPGQEPESLSNLHLILGVADGKSWKFLSTPVVWKYGHDYTATGTISNDNARLTLDGKTLATEPAGFKPDNTALVVNDYPGWAQAPAEYLLALKSVEVTDEGRRTEDGGEGTRRGARGTGSGSRFGKGPGDRSKTEDGGGRRKTVSAAGRLHIVFPAPPPIQVRLFGGIDTRRYESWRVSPGQTLTIQVKFRLDPRLADLRALSPFIDRYGQSIEANWPEKVHTDADLKAAAQQEAKMLKTMPPSPDYDPFGGYKRAGWKGKATGFYSTAQHNGRWWLISPLGNPTFYVGIDTAPALTWESTPVTGREFLFASLPPRTGPTAAAWSQNPWGTDPGTMSVAFRSMNMLHKYGPNWQNVEKALTVRRLRSWGFSGLGKWSDALPGVPYLPVLSTSGVPKIARHADIFDPAVRAVFREALRKQIEPRLKDPYVVGWSIGNEYDEIITPDEVHAILKKPASVPAKQALVDYAIDHVYGGDVAKAAQAAGVTADTRAALYAAPITLPAAAIESVRRFYEDRYYDFLYRTVKGIDPNHLYLGFWISYGWWVNENDWLIIGRHCDVIGYDRYAYTFGDPDFDRLTKESAKPILCGEFSFPPGYHAQRGFGFYPSSAPDEAESATDYTRWMEAAAANPYCVGTCWFQYRDEPLTGRGPGHGPELVLGEHYAFGLVDEADRPKWNLIQPVRRANLHAAAERMK